MGCSFTGISALVFPSVEQAAVQAEDFIVAFLGGLFGKKDKTPPQKGPAPRPIMPLKKSAVPVKKTLKPVKKPAVPVKKTPAPPAVKPSAPSPVEEKAKMSDIDFLREQLREIQEVMGAAEPAAEAPASDKRGFLDIPLNKVLKILPPEFVRPDIAASGQMTVTVIVDDLFDQLKSGRVTTPLRHIISEIPDGYLTPESRQHMEDMMSLPLPLVVSSMEPGELKRRTASRDRELGVRGMPNVFSKDQLTPKAADAMRAAAEPAPVEAPPPAVEEPAPEPEIPAVPEAAVVEETLPEEPVAEEPAPEEPAAEPPAVEEPVFAQEPAGEPPVAEEPVAEEAPAEEEAVEEPVAEEPVAAEPEEEPVAVKEPAEAEEEMSPEAMLQKILEEETPAPEEEAPVEMEAPAAEETAAEEAAVSEEELPEEELLREVPEEPAEAVPVEGEPEAVYYEEPAPVEEAAEPVPEEPVREEAPAGEESALPAAAASAEEVKEGLYLYLRGVDLNQATVEELMSGIGGISHTLAENIVATRQASGQYFYLTDLLRVPGLGRKTFERLTGQKVSSDATRYAELIHEILGPPKHGIPSVRDVVRRFTLLEDFDGCIITHSDGYTMASSWDHPKEEALGAFTPQMFKKVAQYISQLDMGALSSITFTIEQQPITIICSGSVFLIAIHVPSRFNKRSVSIAQAIGAEIGRRLTSARDREE